MVPKISDKIFEVVSARDATASDLKVRTVQYDDNVNLTSFTVDSTNNLQDGWTSKTPVFLGIYNVDANEEIVPSSQRIFLAIRKGATFEELQPLNDAAKGKRDADRVAEGMVVRADITTAQQYVEAQVLKALVNPDGSPKELADFLGISIENARLILALFNVESSDTITDYVTSTEIKIHLIDQNTDVVLSNVTGLTYTNPAQDTSIARVERRKVIIETPPGATLGGRLSITGSTNDTFAPARFKSLGQTDSKHYYILVGTDPFQQQHIINTTPNDVFTWQVKRNPKITWEGLIDDDSFVTTFLQLTDVVETTYDGHFGNYVRVDKAKGEIIFSTLEVALSDIDAANSPEVGYIVSVDTDTTKIKYIPFPRLIETVEKTNPLGAWTVAGVSAGQTVITDQVVPTSSFANDSSPPEDVTYAPDSTGVRIDIADTSSRPYGVFMDAIMTDDDYKLDASTVDLSFSNTETSANEHRIGRITNSDGAEVIFFDIIWNITGSQRWVQLKMTRTALATPTVKISVGLVRTRFTPDTSDIHSLIPGGTKGQSLVKKSSVDYDVEWASDPMDDEVDADHLVGDVEVGLLGVKPNREFETRQITKSDLDDELDDVVDAVEGSIEYKEIWFRDNNFQFALTSGQTEAGEVNSTFPNFNFNTTHRLSATETSYIKIISKKDSKGQTRQFDEEAIRLINRLIPTTSPSELNLDSFTRLEDYTDSINEIFDAYTSKTAHSFSKNIDWDLQQKRVEPAIKEDVNIPNFVNTLPPVEVGKTIYLEKEVTANNRNLLIGFYNGIHYGSDFEASAVRGQFRSVDGWGDMSLLVSMTSPLQFCSRFRYRISGNNIDVEVWLAEGFTRNQSKCYIGVYNKNATSNAPSGEVFELNASFTKTSEQLVLLNNRTYSKWQLSIRDDAPAVQEFNKLNTHTDYNIIFYRDIGQDEWLITEAYGVDTGDYWEPSVTSNLLAGNRESLHLVDQLPEPVSAGTKAYLLREQTLNSRNLIPGAYENVAYLAPREQSALAGNLVEADNSWREISLETGAKSPLQFIRSCRIYAPGSSYFQIEVWVNRAYVSSDNFYIEFIDPVDQTAKYGQDHTLNQTTDTITLPNGITYTKFNWVDTNQQTNAIIKALQTNKRYEVHLYARETHNHFVYGDTFRVPAGNYWEPLANSEQYESPQLLGSEVINTIHLSSGTTVKMTTEQAFNSLPWSGSETTSPALDPTDAFPPTSYHSYTPHPNSVDEIDFIRHPDQLSAILTLEGKSTSSEVIGFGQVNDTILGADEFYSASKSRFGYSDKTLWSLAVDTDEDSNGRKYAWVIHTQSSTTNPTSCSLARFYNSQDATQFHRPGIEHDTTHTDVSISIDPRKIRGTKIVPQRTGNNQLFILLDDASVIQVDVTNGSKKTAIAKLPNVDGAAPNNEDYSGIGWDAGANHLHFIQQKHERTISYQVKYAANGDIQSITLNGTATAPLNSLDLSAGTVWEHTSTNNYTRYSGLVIVANLNRVYYQKRGTDSDTGRLKGYVQVIPLHQAHPSTSVFKHTRGQPLVVGDGVLMSVPKSELHNNGGSGYAGGGRIEVDIDGHPFINSINTISIAMGLQKVDGTDSKPDLSKVLAYEEDLGATVMKAHRINFIDGHNIATKESDAWWNAAKANNRNGTMIYVEPDEFTAVSGRQDRGVKRGAFPQLTNGVYYIEFAFVKVGGRFVKVVFDVVKKTASTNKYKIPYLEELDAIWY